ncbi:hypothetical protein BV22DRAFT_933098 [Leucogyrophana mollusca]|uniref:Uncharacterized protein n=1 Tax=Leucogyrophana mollusca TaxID=85980 RepID=A0ACB8AW66_9AGAM|nr:hypothetical protein BV22DRAFT_933098 [Leucogyrophana mollusca]
MQSDPGPKETPTRPSTSKMTEALKSTPHNRGSAVRSENLQHTGVQVLDVRPWIARDVERAQLCKIDAMLDFLLRRCWEQKNGSSPNLKPPSAEKLRDLCLKTVLPICNGKPVNGVKTTDIKGHLGDYAEALVEKARYKPFISAFNIALEALRHTRVAGLPDEYGEPIIFQQNDPSEMHQTHRGRTSRRKPDVVIIPTKISKRVVTEELLSKKGTRSEQATRARKAAQIKTAPWIEYAREHAAQKPPSRLNWEDILGVIEFKSKGQKLKEPPTSYPVPARELPSDYYLSTADLKALEPADDAEMINEMIDPQGTSAPGEVPPSSEANARSDAPNSGTRTKSATSASKLKRRSIPPEPSNASVEQGGKAHRKSQC